MEINAARCSHQRDNSFDDCETGDHNTHSYRDDRHEDRGEGLFPEPEIPCRSNASATCQGDCSVSAWLNTTITRLINTYTEHLNAARDNQETLMGSSSTNLGLHVPPSSPELDSLDNDEVDGPGHPGFRSPLPQGPQDRAYVTDQLDRSIDRLSRRDDEMLDDFIPVHTPPWDSLSLASTISENTAAPEYDSLSLSTVSSRRSATSSDMAGTADDSTICLRRYLDLERTCDWVVDGAGVLWPDVILEFADVRVTSEDGRREQRLRSRRGDNLP